MYLIIDADYRIFQTKVLSGYVRSQARQGNLSVVNLKTMRGINTPQFAKEIGEEWSDIPEFVREEAA